MITTPSIHPSVLSPSLFLSPHHLHHDTPPSLSLPQAKPIVADPDPNSFVTQSEEVDKGQEEVEEKEKKRKKNQTMTCQATTSLYQVSCLDVTVRELHLLKWKKQQQLQQWKIQNRLLLIQPLYHQSDYTI